eukprot:365224-Chlamydomonas_euryale.AAC.14
MPKRETECRGEQGGSVSEQGGIPFRKQRHVMPEHAAFRTHVTVHDASAVAEVERLQERKDHTVR